MKKRTTKIIVFTSLLSILIPAALIGSFFYIVLKETSEQIERGAIERVIASESPVYYDDGVTPIGVFFDKTHRKYVPYREMPRDFVNALIATEDKNFFHHRGFDTKAIIRALLANIKAGRIVQGGSTITQQTAKNVFRREKRTYWAKLKELIQSIMLERRYSKEEILEMYANQFFVTGYGKGLGIAARYFFGKNTKDLNLVESAFIAGALKGPNRFNPFIKIAADEREKARLLARQRKDYVLLNMFRMNFINEDQYIEAKTADVPFREGKITYSLNVILDYVRKQLDSDFFRKILSEQGIENVATSGIEIYTSVNREIQATALSSLRRHVPLLDVMLNGYKLYDIAETAEGISESALKNPKDDLPFMARIIHVKRSTTSPHIKVKWEEGEGIVGYQGLRPICNAWQRWKKGVKKECGTGETDGFLKNLRVGDLVAIQRIPSSSRDDSDHTLILSQIPELEGAIVVLKNGMVKGMAGGFFNRYFNRVADAKRQLGSIFKPILFTAALQLKWNITDILPNRRELLRFENTSYVPKPDHKPMSDSVSLAWAGVKSENLATVWLLYHLTDRLNISEFKKVAAITGLLRGADESYTEYKKRIRDKHGVIVNTDALMEAAFEESKMELESDIIFEGSDELLENLRRLQYLTDWKSLQEEFQEELEIARFSFQRLRELNLRMESSLHEINQVLSEIRGEVPRDIEEKLWMLLKNFYNSKRDDGSEILVYSEDENMHEEGNLFRMTPDAAVNTSESFTAKKVLLDGIITSKSIELLQKNTERKYRNLASQKNYDIEVLYKIRDFRILVNLSYVSHCAHSMGVSTPLDPVLSFPLGPNAVSIMEAARVYQTIMTGCVYSGFTPEMKEESPIITKITDRQGEVIFEYENKPRRILSERVSGQVSEILKLVMRSGTGSSAGNSVRIFNVPIPTFGKTGTANRFTNSSFVGYIPGIKEETLELALEEGYVIASYVGYDDNRPMKSKNIAIYGSSGALPLWVDTADAIIDAEKYEKKLQVADLAFEPLWKVLLPWNENTVPIAVSPVSGLPELDGRLMEGVVMLADIRRRGSTFIRERIFEPLIGVSE